METVVINFKARKERNAFGGEVGGFMQRRRTASGLNKILDVVY